MCPSRSSSPREASGALPECDDSRAPGPGHGATIDLGDRLRTLESEAIHVLREVAAECERPALLFSGGKDSIVMVHLARKAFAPAKLPFPLLHIDTEHNFPEAIAFRDALVRRLDERLLVRSVETAIREGRAVEDPGPFPSRNRAQIPTLLDAIAELRLDALIGGARRDEERSRAKERIFSFRDEFGRWNPRAQRPELWSLYNTRIRRAAPTSAGIAEGDGGVGGEHLRVFPLSNWTELDVWEYVRLERIALPSIYFAHSREVVVRDGTICPISDFFPLRPGETAVRRTVRFRTVGDMTCTAAVESDAATIDEVIAEIEAADLSERGARLDDRTGDAAMEDRKREGYF